MAKRRKRDFFRCPHCGAEVRHGALACPECGSDEDTGWSAAAAGGEIDYGPGYGEDDEFDYDDFVANEFPEHADRSPKGASAKRFWAIVAFVVVVALVLGILSR